LGETEVVEFKLQEAEVKFRIWNNFFAELCCEESAYCNCVEGFVSGIYEQIIRETPNIKKTKCATKRDP
jgi:predicted hydrocarbon binding protein